MDNEPISEQVAKFVMISNIEKLKEMTVSSIADKFQVNRSHLAREFKSDKNFTLCQFIQREKILRAATLLRETDDLTVAGVAGDLGFCSVGYFREVFKKHFGVVPSKYKEYKNYNKKGIQRREQSRE